MCETENEILHTTMLKNFQMLRLKNPEEALRLRGCRNSGKLYMPPTAPCSDTSAARGALCTIQGSSSACLCFGSEARNFRTKGPPATDQLIFTLRLLGRVSVLRIQLDQLRDKLLRVLGIRAQRFKAVFGTNAWTVIN